jgi:hypothetical protein
MITLYTKDQLQLVAMHIFDFKVVQSNNMHRGMRLNRKCNSNRTDDLQNKVLKVSFI